jgi:hypothetical protein
MTLAETIIEGLSKVSWQDSGGDRAVSLYEANVIIREVVAQWERDIEQAQAPDPNHFNPSA